MKPSLDILFLFRREFIAIFIPFFCQIRTKKNKLYRLSFAGQLKYTHTRILDVWGSNYDVRIEMYKSSAFVHQIDDDDKLVIDHNYTHLNRILRQNGYYVYSRYLASGHSLHVTSNASQK